jgi:glucokinase
MADAIGIDFGGTQIKSGRVADGKIVQRGTVIETRACRGTRAILDALVRVVEELREANPANVVALGVGLPGIVDSVRGVVHELTNVPGWEDVALRDLLIERTGLPTTIENDANAMAYGEFKQGAARNGRHVVCITLGTGVGGALILDGRLYRGAHLGAGEIGHVSIDFRGVPGPYGNAGALEKYVGNSQIAERAVLLYMEAGQTKSATDCAPHLLSAAAAAGDKIARGLWEAIGIEIGVALANVVWVLNPDTIVIGGGVAKAGELILEPVRRTIRERTIDIFHRDLRVVPAALGNDAGIIGNAALASEAAQARDSQRQSN